MRSPHKIAVSLLVASLAASFGGCADRNTTATDGQTANGQTASDKKGESQAASEMVRVADVLAAWESGNKDEAVKQLLAVPWEAEAVFDGLPILNLSEERFMSLAASERTSTQEEAMKIVPTLKDLARHAISAGDNAQVSGDSKAARMHYEAVLNFGKALSSPQRLQIIQLIGNATVRFAEDKMRGDE